MPTSGERGQSTSISATLEGCWHDAGIVSRVMVGFDALSTLSAMRLDCVRRRSAHRSGVRASDTRQCLRADACHGNQATEWASHKSCLLYTSDAADERSSV